MLLRAGGTGGLTIALHETIKYLREFAAYALGVDDGSLQPDTETSLLLLHAVVTATEATGHTQTQLARLAGMPPTAIATHMRLTEHIDWTVVDALKKGRVTVDTVKLLATLQRDDQPEALGFVTSGQLPTGFVEQFVTHVKRGLGLRESLYRTLNNANQLHLLQVPKDEPVPTHPTTDQFAGNTIIEHLEKARNTVRDVKLLDSMTILQLTTVRDILADIEKLTRKRQGSVADVLGKKVAGPPILANTEDDEELEAA